MVLALDVPRDRAVRARAAKIDTKLTLHGDHRLPARHALLPWTYRIRHDAFTTPDKLWFALAFRIVHAAQEDGVRTTNKHLLGATFFAPTVRLHGTPTTRVNLGVATELVQFDEFLAGFREWQT